MIKVIVFSPTVTIILLPLICVEQVLEPSPICNVDVELKPLIVSLPSPGVY